MAKEDTQQNVDVTEEILRDIEEGEGRNAPEVIFKGDEELDAPMVMKRLKGDDGLIPIYDRQTGDKSMALKYMLRELLKAKDPDTGQLRFTLTQPKLKVEKKTFECLLHPSNPNRTHYDELGFPVCLKDDITSPFMVKKHMKSRHKIEWETIEEERKEKEKREDKEFQQSLLGGVVKPQSQVQEVTAPIKRRPGRPKKKK